MESPRKLTQIDIPAIKDLRLIKWPAATLACGAATIALSAGNAEAALRSYSFSNVSYTYSATGDGNGCTKNNSCSGTMSGYFVWDNSTSQEGNGSLTVTKNPVARLDNTNCGASSTDCNNTRTYNRWAASGSDIIFWDSTNYDMIRLSLVSGLSSNDQRYLSFSGASSTDGFSSTGSANLNGSAPTFSSTKAITLNNGNNVNIAPNPSVALGIAPFAFLALSRRKGLLPKRRPTSPHPSRPLHNLENLINPT